VTCTYNDFVWPCSVGPINQAKKHQRLATLLLRSQTGDKFTKCNAATATSTAHHHAGHIAPGNTVIMSCTGGLTWQTCLVRQEMCCAPHIFFLCVEKLGRKNARMIKKKKLPTFKSCKTLKGDVLVSFCDGEGTQCTSLVTHSTSS